MPSYAPPPVGTTPQNPTGLCRCGCGEYTDKIRTTKTRLNRYRGDYNLYIFGHHRRALSEEAYLVDDISGCWVWQRSVHKGRPQLSAGGSGKVAARVYYEHKFGDIPAGHEIHHKCWNPLCVNPDHLLALSTKAHRELHRQAFLDCGDILHQRFVSSLNSQPH